MTFLLRNSQFPRKKVLNLHTIKKPSLEMMITISKLLKVDLNDLVRIEAVPDPIIKESSED